MANSVWFHQYELLRIVKIIWIIESRLVYIRGLEGPAEMDEYLLDRVSVLEDENSSGNGWYWWLHNNMNVLYISKL